MTKIITSIFIADLILHGVAALLTYITISSGRFIEGNPTAAQLQFNYGVSAGLTITLLQGTLLSAVPLTIYLGMLMYARSNYVPPHEKMLAMQFVKFVFFPLALFVLVFLTTVAGVDAAHDLAMFLSGGQVNLWSF